MIFKTSAKHNNFIKPLDYVVFAGALLLLALLIGSLLTRTSDERFVYIKTANGERFHNINQDQKLTLAGPVGLTEVVIHNQTVAVTRSPGKQQICVNKGAISKGGEWLICLPNQILIRILGAEADNQIDSQSY